MRRWLVAAAVLAVAALAPMTASAALLWALVASPSTAVANQSTTFSFTATNLDLLQVLGCLEVDLPGSFLITGTGTPTTNNGDAWVSSVSGSAVVVHSINGGGRLKPLETVTFTVQARPTVAGAFGLPNHSHVHQDCSGTDQPGVALPITVLSGPTPTPVPTPTPRPTLMPTPLPVPTLPLPSLPLPTLPLPSVLPTTPPLPESTPMPRPTDPAIAASSPSDSLSPSSSPRSSATPAASDSADPSAAGPGSVSGGPTGGGTDGGTPAVRLEPRELTLNTELVDLLGSPQVWFVPAAAIGAPGLLVLLWVALQTVGTMAWIPSVRRMRGQERRGSTRSRRVGTR